MEGKKNVIPPPDPLFVRNNKFPSLWFMQGLQILKRITN